MKLIHWESFYKLKTECWLLRGRAVFSSLYPRTHLFIKEQSLKKQIAILKFCSKFVNDNHEKCYQWPFFGCLQTIINNKIPPKEVFWLCFSVFHPEPFLVGDLFDWPLLIALGINPPLTSVFVLPQQCSGLWKLFIQTVSSTQRHRCTHTYTNLTL